MRVFTAQELSVFLARDKSTAKTVAPAVPPEEPPAAHWVALWFGARYAAESCIAAEESSALLGVQLIVELEPKKGKKKGKTIGEALDTCLRRAAVPVDSAAAVLRTYARWVDLIAAVEKLLSSLGESSPSDAMPRNQWLRWAHQWGDAGGDDGNVAPGRSHWFARLLLALTGSERSLMSVFRLNKRLTLREGAPYSWEVILQALVLRRPLGHAASELSSDQLRKLSLAKLLGTHARLSADQEAKSLEEWIAGAIADVETAIACVDRERDDSSGLDALWPATRFYIDAEGSPQALLGPQLAPPGAKPIYISKIMKCPAFSTVHEMIARSGPERRLSAALAFVINMDADNFARREMPSLNDWWPKFNERVIKQWLKPRACAASSVSSPTCLFLHTDNQCLAAGKPLYRAPLCFNRDSEPWTASLLYLVVTERIVSQAVPNEDEQVAVARYLQDVAGWIRDFPEEFHAPLRAFCEAIGPGAISKFWRIWTQEQRLRWRSVYMPSASTRQPDDLADLDETADDIQAAIEAREYHEWRRRMAPPHPRPEINAIVALALKSAWHKDNRGLEPRLNVLLPVVIKHLCKSIDSLRYCASCIRKSLEYSATIAPFAKLIVDAARSAHGDPAEAINARFLQVEEGLRKGRFHETFHSKSR